MHSPRAILKDAVQKQFWFSEDFCQTSMFFLDYLIHGEIFAFTVRLLFPTFGLKIFIRKNTYVTNQIPKIILSKQIFNLNSESDLRFCISLDSDSCNNRISKRLELSQDFEIKCQSPFIRTRFLFFGTVLQTFLANNEIFQDFASQMFSDFFKIPSRFWTKSESRKMENMTKD